MMGLLEIAQICTRCYEIFERLMPTKDHLGQVSPLRPEAVGPGEGAVSADDGEVGDAALQEVPGGPQHPRPGLELHAAGRAYHGAAPVDDAGHGGPVRLHDPLAPVDHALVQCSHE